jgi:diguanylate cyclase (GGDEF)-like protein
MDWQPIDRFILLGFLVLLSPGLFTPSLLAALEYAPEYLNRTIAERMLVFWATHFLLLSGFIACAFWRRKTQSDWPLFENFIIGSYTVVILISSYMTGSHFTEGLLLLFLGVNITSVLANVRKIRAMYWLVAVSLILLAVNDFTGFFEHAPLLERSVYREDGSPAPIWLFIEVQTAVVLSALIYLCLIAVQRWVERESLYKEMSTTDGLTRLTNRRCFIQRGEQEIERMQRLPHSPETNLACIMLDLDHFKSINDTWGHHAGDAALVAAAKIMMANARKYDEVARYGGEEFAVLLPGADMDLAETVAERLRKRIAEETIDVDGQTIQFTASFGIASFPSHGLNDVNDLLKAADAALYEAKTSGRNRVVRAKADASEPGLHPA